MIPLLFAQSGNLQAAIEQTRDFLVANVQAFEVEVEQLRASEEASRELKDFITGCKYYCTGNLAWRYVLFSP